jgi:transcriptional regulator with XRE-family HTH domain
MLTLVYTGAVDWERIRTRFRALRVEAGLSQDEVGALVKKTASAISFFETGTTRVRIHNLEMYCEAIDASLVLEVVPKAEAALIQRLIDVLPWASPDARKLLRQAIKTAEILKRAEAQRPAGEASTAEVDDEPTTTGAGRGGRGRH